MLKNVWIIVNAVTFGHILNYGQNWPQICEKKYAKTPALKIKKAGKAILQAHNNCYMLWAQRPALLQTLCTRCNKSVVAYYYISSALHFKTSGYCPEKLTLYFVSSREWLWRHWARPRIHTARCTLSAPIPVFLFEHMRKHTSCARDDKRLCLEYVLTSRSFSGWDKV